jgi:hypothetical protein
LVTVVGVLEVKGGAPITLIQSKVWASQIRMVWSLDPVTILFLREESAAYDLSPE